ncbi:hypothetical protein L6452_30484 [Arctium lappa]|uniref:Uncharacterized protein n=1 Tax=Arctium lappa TaxID=4217 RepID=A0ACB8ZJM7_ARCLA|nr:hypothetical protein L6452_30484 [Arctium lappa]
MEKKQAISSSPQVINLHSSFNGDSHLHHHSSHRCSPQMEHLQIHLPKPPIITTRRFHLLNPHPQKNPTNSNQPSQNPPPPPSTLISSPELCLIIDDRPNSNLTSQIAKNKIKADAIPVTKVIKLSKLKTDYKPFESKRKLCDSYEMFSADKRVIPLLPKLLGKQFFKKKKLPLPVDLGHKNWKEQIERGCCSGLLFFRTGTCSVVRVAKGCMKRDEIVENVGAAIDGVIGFVPKKLCGVRSLHLKFSESVALPLYQYLPDIKLRIEKEKNEAMEIEEELNKGRIHEVNHDEGEVIDLCSDELVGKKRKGEFTGVKKSAKVKMVSEKKKKKGNVVEGDDVDTILIDKKEILIDKKAMKKNGDNIGKKEKKKGRV